MKTHTKEELTATIVEIIKSKKKFDTSFDGYKTSHLFGQKLGLQARELIWLLFTIQDKFSICIQQEDILNNYCYTIDGLASLIQKKCLTNQHELHRQIEPQITKN